MADETLGDQVPVAHGTLTANVGFELSAFTRHVRLDGLFDRSEMSRF
jgi:hypothetical protein